MFHGVASSGTLTCLVESASVAALHFEGLSPRTEGCAAFSNFRTLYAVSCKVVKKKTILANISFSNLKDRPNE
jgi:hypothetical protein